MWLETGTKELRILNEKYEKVVVHQRRFGKNSSLQFISKIAKAKQIKGKHNLEFLFELLLAEFDECD